MLYQILVFSYIWNYNLKPISVSATDTATSSRQQKYFAHVNTSK